VSAFSIIEEFAFNPNRSFISASISGGDERRFRFLAALSISRILSALSFVHPVQEPLLT
jgi:hypothetical protein